MVVKELSFDVDEKHGVVSALLARPRGARALYVLAHGAGTGMRHAFMEAMAERLYARKLATFRFQFPYMEAGRKAPNTKRVLLATIERALPVAAKAAPKLPLFAGGKSMGGRMTSLAGAAGTLANVRGLIYLGFPLHAPAKPGAERGAHLSDIELPMLFLQGTRDKLARMELIEPLCKKLGRRTTLHIVDGGDHSFHVLKRSGRTDEEALDELADTIDTWIAGQL